MASKPNSLRDEQYKSGNNLTARIELHTKFSTNPLDWYTWVFNQFNAPSTAIVLELGAGTAGLWKANAHRIPQNWQITLSDFSPGMVEEQRQNLKGARGSFNFEVIDAQAIPYKSNFFDMVIANHMLYHVPDLPKALSEIRRVLKPGGIFYAATNGAQHMRELDTLVHGYDNTVEPLIEALTFTTENGTAFLEPFFSSVILHHYEDTLVVSEVEPLVAYILSGWHLPTIHQANFTEYVRREMSKTGVISITKEVGLFIAS